MRPDASGGGIFAKMKVAGARAMVPILRRVVGGADKGC
jgi:hypothetical protein